MSKGNFDDIAKKTALDELMSGAAVSVKSKKTREEKALLQIKVPKSLKKKFRTEAIALDMTMGEYFLRVYDAYTSSE